MAQIESWFAQDLTKPVKVHYIDGNVFSQDNDGNLVGVRVFADGEPATLSGTVAANVIRADGGTVAVSGTLSGNAVSVVLPAAAYAIPGIISIIIKLTDGETITTLCAAVANVYQSSTDTIIDPGTIIPSIQTLIDTVENVETQVEEVIASIPEDYTNLSNDVDNLKSALNAVSDEDYYRGISNLFESGGAWLNGQTVTYTTTDKNIRIKQGTTIHLNVGDIIEVDSTVQYRLISMDGTKSTLVNFANTSYTVVTEGEYLIIVRYASDASISDMDALLYLFRIHQKSSQLNYKFGEIEDSIETLYDEEYYRIVYDLFEMGGGYLNGNSITYNDGTVKNIRIKKNTTIHLNVGDRLVAEKTAQYRLIYMGSTKSQLVNFSSDPYTITTAGEYFIVVRYATDEDISDKDALLKLFGIVQNSSHLKRKIDSMESGKYDSLKMNDHHNYILEPDQFELGTTTIGTGSALQYFSSTTVIRPKQDTFISLSAGDIIVPKTGIKVRIIHITDDTTSPKKGEILNRYGDFSTFPVHVESAGKYTFAITFTSGATISDVSDILKYFEIIKADSDLLSLPNPKEDNSAKGVFGIMSYNVGQWWNGSGAVASDEKFDTLYAMQKSILDLYDADVLCLQEYKNELTQNTSALGLLIDPRYVNQARYATAHVYTGKLIATNKKLTDGANVAFTHTGANPRNYEKAYVWLNGRKVLVISTHIDQDPTNAAGEFDELLTAVDGEDYCIICMDSNVDCSDHESSLYQNTMKKFTDLGYKLVNDGSYITYEPENLPIDQIIVTSNINIKSVVVDKQKYGFADGEDHYPLIAYLEVY